MEYLIKTYTDESETVLDFCMGSGTTGIAAKKNNRNFVGIEKDKKVAFRKDCQKEYTTKTLTQEILIEGKLIIDSKIFNSLKERYIHNLKENVLDPFLENKNFRLAIKDYGSKSVSLGNISDACRKLGVSCCHYFDIKFAIEKEGLEGLFFLFRFLASWGCICWQAPAAYWQPSFSLSLPQCQSVWDWVRCRNWTASFRL